MHVEFTGLIEASPESSASLAGTVAAPSALGGVRAALTRARLFEHHGFDRVRLPQAGGGDDRSDAGWLAGFLLAGTTSIGVALPHAAGETSPVAAAEALAGLDRRAPGRLAVLVGAAAGTPADHECDLARTDEYLVLLKRLWANVQPFDHEGPRYSLKGARAAARPLSQDGLPLVLSGRSGTAIQVAARHADVFSLEACEPGEAHQTLSRVLAAAQALGRAAKIRFAVEIEAAPDAAPEATALSVLRLAELGVGEFVVRGLDTPGAIAAFGGGVIPLVRRSLDRPAALAAQPRATARFERRN